MKRPHALLLCVLLSACAGPQRKAGVVPIPAADWPAFADELDAASLASAAQKSAAYLRGLEPKLLRIGDREVAPQLLIDTLEELVRIKREVRGPGELAARIRAGFDLYRVGAAAKVSAYYMPVLPASRRKTREYRYPLFKRPPDMVEADLGAFDPKLKGRVAIGRVDESGDFVPYFDRADIDIRKELDGRGLEIAWLGSGFDRLNLHIQGSGILRYPDGKEALARYAATNALPYKSVGMTVVNAGVMRRDEITAEKLKDYLDEHPEGEAWLISRNPRYTFFSLEPLPPGGEPFGSAGHPLVAGRSIAVDTSVLPLGTAAFLSFPMAQADEDGRLLEKRATKRFVLAQDTGGAIRGAGRLDLYLGHGAQAEAEARGVWEQGELYLLLKKAPARTR